MRTEKVEVPYGDCPECRTRQRVTAKGLIFRHQRWYRRKRAHLDCPGGGRPAKPVSRVRTTIPPASSEVRHGE